MTQAVPPGQMESAKSRTTRAPLGPSFWSFGLALILLWGSVIYQIGVQWSIYEQYAYGWAVPFLCLFLLWRNIQQGEKVHLTDAPSSWGPGTGVIVGLFFFAVVAFLPLRIIVEANPIWRAASYVLAIDAIVITLALSYLVGGRIRLAQFFFPFCFFLVAIPWPSAVENTVIQTLTRLNTAATVELLGIFGVPALQHGNVIEISLGRVGVDEACSGVRSVQATLMMTLFFGAFYQLRASRRPALVVIGLLLALVCNLIRTFFLAWIASRNGLDAVEKWHDPAGVTILVICFFGVWLCSEKLAKQGPPSARSDEWIGQTGNSPGTKGAGLLGRVSFQIAFAVWLLICIVFTELWFRSNERFFANRVDWLIKWPEEKSGFRKVPIPPEARDQLKFNEGHNYAWREEDGTMWQSFFLHWQSASTFKERTTVHLAKTHRPERCLTASGKILESQSSPQVIRVGNVELPYRSMVFSDHGQKLHVFFVAWEEGTPPDSYANMRADTHSRLAAAWSGSRGKGQRVLEVATWGHPDLATAESAFKGLISQLIVPIPTLPQR